MKQKWINWFRHVKKCHYNPRCLTKNLYEYAYGEIMQAHADLVGSFFTVEPNKLSYCIPNLGFAVEEQQIDKYTYSIELCGITYEISRGKYNFRATHIYSPHVIDADLFGGKDDLFRILAFYAEEWKYDRKILEGLKTYDSPEISPCLEKDIQVSSETAKYRCNVISFKKSDIQVDIKLPKSYFYQEEDNSKILICDNSLIIPLVKKLTILKQALDIEFVSSSPHLVNLKLEDINGAYRDNLAELRKYGEMFLKGWKDFRVFCCFNSLILYNERMNFLIEIEGNTATADLRNYWDILRDVMHNPYFRYISSLSIKPFRGNAVSITGDYATYSYDSKKNELVISGNRRMQDYNDASEQPWHELSGEIESIIIEEGVKSIGSRAFDGCTNLKSVEIPHTVRCIGDYSFCRCASLSSIILPDSVLEIKSGAFEECTSLVDIIIPNSIIEIGSMAFMNCKELKSIKIPEGIKEIADATFFRCTSLSNVFIPNSVEIIRDCAFKECSSLSSVIMPPNLRIIGSQAFLSCSSLSTVKIPHSVFSVGCYAFGYCSSLVSFVVEGEPRNGGIVLRGCESLETFEGPLYWWDWDYSSFDICRNLKTYIIQPGLTQIDDLLSVHGYRFKYFSSLIIPESIRKIKRFRMSYWENNIKEVHIHQKVPTKLEIDDKFFEELKDATLFVPKESLKDYLNDKRFRDFKEIIAEELPWQ